MVRRATLAVLFIMSVTLAAQTPARAPQIDSISADQMRADLFFLAGDSMQGRLTDTPENALAADWVLSRFQRLGLQPGGGGSSFEHRYPLMTATLGPDNAVLIGELPASGTRYDLRVGEDFYPHRFSANAAAEAPLTFAGFGILSPERGHDDYRDAVRGRIALVLDREPGVNDPNSPFDGVVTAEAAVAIKKVLAAQDRGAVGVIFVEDVHNQSGAGNANFQGQASNYWPTTPPRVERYTLKAWSDRVRIPVIQMSVQAVDRMLASTKQSLLALAKTSETRGGVTPVLLNISVAMKTSVQHHTVPDRSIVAHLEGGDPKLKNEYVLISAHFDHDGADGPRILNGADDDGSGTVALIEIAEAFALAAQVAQRPKRSVMFAAWNTEERGLLGAWAYTEFPVVPLDRIVGVLNMDMIGRNEEVPVGGGGRFRGLDIQTAESNSNATNIIGTVRSPDFRTLLEKSNQGIGLDLRFRYDNNVSNLMRRSDHWPFIQRGVPGVWVHTGLHPDYHTIYDRPEKINYPKMAKITRFVYQAAWDMANADARPRLLPPGSALTTDRQ